MIKKNKPFEKLLDEYIFGNMNISTYRSERANLIVQITDSEIQKDITIPKSTVRVNVDLPQVQETEKSSSFYVPLIEKDNSLNNTAITQYTLVAVFVIIGGIFWYLTSQSKIERESLSPPLEENISNTNNELDQPFIMAFNQKTDWNTEAMSNFLVQWQSLTTSQQNNARQSPSFVKLTEILKSRIDQQKMVSINKIKKISRRESLLIWFASQLSIDPN